MVCNLLVSVFIRSACKYSLRRQPSSLSCAIECMACHTKVQKKNLGRHFEEVHKSERVYTCQYCTKKYKRWEHLLNHLSSHEKDKPYKCHICTATYAQSSGLYRHLQSHKTDVIPYTCAQCGKEFSRRDHLRVHMVTHTKEKPFQCDICLEEFGYESTLKRHISQLHTDMQ